ncbi:LPS-assembly lipoprotein LptE [Limnohabitans sp.]|uniref:LPS-assembly lipoprotein LptE n=1 Tax=Limnohabitans sp. TaxID=1907725 RepID=UPI002FDD4407
MHATRRAWLMSAASLAGLAGCGFELRKPPRYSFSTLFSSIPIVSPLGVRLKRSLEASGQVEVITDPRQIERAQVIFDQLFELREKVVVGRTSTGAIREFQLRLRYRFRVRSRNGFELIPETEITLNRDINFNETGALSKESEEALLYKDMEDDLVLQIQRRLAAIRQI